MTIPFYNIHLDIWSPGNVLNEHEDGGKILNCMCDLKQFIVSCILINTRAEALSTNNGLRTAHTVWHTMFGVIAANNYIFS